MGWVPTSTGQIGHFSPENKHGIRMRFQIFKRPVSSSRNPCLVLRVYKLLQRLLTANGNPELMHPWLIHREMCCFEESQFFLVFARLLFFGAGGGVGVGRTSLN